MEGLAASTNKGDPTTLEVHPCAKGSKYSVVIPVFNSAPIVGDTIDRTIAFFETYGFDHELILVNDGSSDGSWDVVREKARANPRIIAIDLLRNSGQHTANLCGFQHSTGDYVVTMDDDLQNPPEEIIHLINKVHEGHDVVFGRFPEKKHASYRRWGSKLIGTVNRRLFHKPKDLVLTNFRIIRQDVVARICSYRTSSPYIPGRTVMFMTRPANVWTEHQDRRIGKSNYSSYRILRLVARILFNYSSYPLQLVTVMGMVVSGISFLAGLFYLCKALLSSVNVPGWTTIVVLLSFFNGITLLILGMLGEYVVRLINHTCVDKPYHIKEIIRADD